jgi:uncharacterized protein
MMLVDAHTHMSGSAVTVVQGFEPADFLGLMDRNGIDQAWVFTLDGLYFDPVPHNDRLITFCSHAPDRLIPFATVHPRHPNAVKELRRCINELGMRGLKLHPWLQSFSPVEPFMDALGDELTALGIPVVFHDGTPPYSSPLQIANFALQHPLVTVILGHAGLHDLWKEAIYAAERCPNIYLIPSGMPPYGLRHALARLSASRFLFGSDAGFGDPYWQTYQLQKVRSMGLSPGDEALILGGNAIQMMRIE